MWRRRNLRLLGFSHRATISSQSPAPSIVGIWKRTPLPCPFNYGSVPSHIGLEGDLLDAVVLGPRLALGTRVRIKAWDAVTLTDRGMSDDKLICSDHAPSPSQRRDVLRFFHFYAKCKGLLNVWRRRPGRNACEGWCGADRALARARPRDDRWQGPPIEF